MSNQAPEASLNRLALLFSQLLPEVRVEVAQGPRAGFLEARQGKNWLVATIDPDRALGPFALHRSEPWTDNDFIAVENFQGLARRAVAHFGVGVGQFERAAPDLAEARSASYGTEAH